MFREISFIWEIAVVSSSRMGRSLDAHSLIWEMSVTTRTLRAKSIDELKPLSTQWAAGSTV